MNETIKTYDYIYEESREGNTIDVYRFSIRKNEGQNYVHIQKYSSPGGKPGPYAWKISHSQLKVGTVSEIIKALLEAEKRLVWLAGSKKDYQNLIKGKIADVILKKLSSGVALHEISVQLADIHIGGKVKEKKFPRGPIAKLFDAGAYQSAVPRPLFVEFSNLTRSGISIELERRWWNPRTCWERVRGDDIGRLIIQVDVLPKFISALRAAQADVEAIVK